MKAQFVADAKIAASGSSEVVESEAISALYVGIAYGTGYGVEQNMEESRSWISRSASQDSPAARLTLEVLENPNARQNLILSTFIHMKEWQASQDRILVDLGTKPPKLRSFPLSRLSMGVIPCIIYQCLRGS